MTRGGGILSHIFRLEKCEVEHTLAKRRFFSTSHFFANRSILVACPTQLCCCLKLENTSTHKSMLCSSCSFSFATRNESFLRPVFSFHALCTDCQRGELRLLCHVSSFLFRDNVGSLLRHLELLVYQQWFSLLSTMVPSDTKWQAS